MFEFLYFLITQRLYYSGKFQMFYQKAAVMDTLVLKPCSLRLYAPLRIHPGAMRAKPCVTWLSVGKHLELPEPVNLCTFELPDTLLVNQKYL